MLIRVMITAAMGAFFDSLNHEIHTFITYIPVSNILNAKVWISLWFQVPRNSPPI